MARIECVRVSAVDFSRPADARGVRPAQPFRQPRRPDRDEREKKHSTTRQEGKRKICIHDSPRRVSASSGNTAKAIRLRQFLSG